MSKDGRIFTVSNFLSFSRVLLVVPIFHLLHQHTQQASVGAVLLMLLAALTDYLDGYLARRLHKTSHIGRVLDPLADKIAVGAVAVLLVVERGFPIWLVAVVLARDLAILAAGLYIARRYHYIVESNMYGKVTVSVLAMLLVVYTLGWEQPSRVLLWASVIMLVVSSINYVRRFVDLRKTFAKQGRLQSDKDRITSGAP